jgi:IclR family acetate operon transcriptional repressor
LATDGQLLSATTALAEPLRVKERPTRREVVQVLSRAAQLLRAVAATPSGLTISDLAEQLHLPRSTTHRIVDALQEEGFISKTASGGLHIGPSLIGIAVSSRRDLRHEAAPTLERLCHELRETVDLAVLDGAEVLFIEQFVSRRALRIVAQIGARFPLHATASGKALLAALPAEQAKRLLPRVLRPLSAKTITDRRVLFGELKEIRQSGIAYDDEEHDLGITALACAFRDGAGDLAAVSVVLPAVRFAATQERIAAALLRARDELQLRLRGK